MRRSHRTERQLSLKWSVTDDEIKTDKIFKIFSKYLNTKSHTDDT